ncbi:hypothetical protein VTN77DRAFT_4731 [Rasamsonia byssochlamydoides]|uniref:uncharacterized protein n=1 Tax=Rasamsonia byssochlamydoides TaxID=89139 RepID=UPI0037421B12
MGKPPAVVFIARHGARIDAVDKKWHLTSPTPYDPPLAYGGWTQGRALGAGIASLLQAREESPSCSSNGAENGAVEAAASGQDTHTHHTNTTSVRKHKVIIHSSPYLRCVQTAIAISAGLSQYHRTSKSSNVKPGCDASSSSEPGLEESSPKSTPLLQPEDNAEQCAEEKKENGQPPSQKGVPKTLLRIDAFLGEWLSPEYFEQITPPPSSVMMVAGAKAELLRRGEGIHRTHDSGNKSISGHFPGGWQSNSNPTSPDKDDDEGRFRNMAAMANSLVNQRRPETHDGQVGPTTRPPTIRDILSRKTSDVNDDFSEGYIPPAPSYAISPSDPIPAGYVAHARDACVDVDYQWDSMREPQDWGSGGDYGEEWSAMHLRFRNGLQSMIDWYRKHDRPEDSDEDFTDVVLVLVTHGAGCNALIGALTSRPVLLDVPMASLTMAVRKDIIEDKDAVPSIAEKKLPQQGEQRRRSSLDITLSREYDISFIASTEHLRPEPNQPSSVPPLKTPTIHHRSSSSISAYRHRPVSPHEPFKFPKDSAAPRGAGLQRAATTKSRHVSHSSVTGLWSALSPTASESVAESGEKDGDNIVSNFGQPASASGSSKPENGNNTSQTANPDSEQPKSQRGLWSSAAIAREREPVQKRRWTVTERR